MYGHLGRVRETDGDEETDTEKRREGEEGKSLV